MREDRRRQDAINTLGAVIREKRRQQQLTQEELANMMGMDRAHLSLLESGKKQPTLSTLFNICDELQLKVSTVIGEVEERL